MLLVALLIASASGAWTGTIIRQGTCSSPPSVFAAVKLPSCSPSACVCAAGFCTETRCSNQEIAPVPPGIAGYITYTGSSTCAPANANAVAGYGQVGCSAQTAIAGFTITCNADGNLEYKTYAGTGADTCTGNPLTTVTHNFGCIGVTNAGQSVSVRTTCLRGVANPTATNIIISFNFAALLTANQTDTLRAAIAAYTGGLTVVVVQVGTTTRYRITITGARAGALGNTLAGNCAVDGACLDDLGVSGLPRVSDAAVDASRAVVALFGLLALLALALLF